MSEEADSDILEHAKGNYQKDADHWNPIFDKGRDDLHFLSDDIHAQWDEKDFNERANTGRPALTIDQLSQFVHQVANEIRMNTPAINVIPAGGEASLETADVLKGLIRKIEYVSSADEVYDTAATSAIKCSIGFIRVDHDFADDEGFDQQLLIKRIINPFLVFMDKETMESDGRDQNHCTILEKMKVSEFKRKYPKAAVVSFDDKGAGRDLGDEEDITIAEYFAKTNEENEITATGKNGKEQRRKVLKPKIMRYKLSGSDVLERTSFPGKYVPIVPVYGEEAWQDGKRELLSLHRKSKQAQQMYNLLKSLETEVLMKQPQAPIMVAAGSIENYKADWIDPTKSMALRYDLFDSEGRQMPPPQRLTPPTLPTGFSGAARETVDDIKATMGMYNQSIGKQGNEVSGVAINARKIEGDVATYHYGDNLVRSLNQVGRILVCAAPEIYDTERLIQIIGEEDEPQTAGINGAKADGDKISHDFAKGIYDVRVTTGASFTTKRQESEAFFQNIIKQQPEMMQIMGDLLFKYSDFPGSKAMQSRMEKIIDPKLLEKDTAEDEQIQALNKQLQQATAQNQQLAAELQSKQQKEQNELTLDQEKINLEREKLKTENQKLINERLKMQLEATAPAPGAPRLAKAVASPAQEGAPAQSTGSDEEEMALGIPELEALLAQRKQQQIDQAAQGFTEANQKLEQHFTDQQAEAQEKANDLAKNAALVGAIVEAVNRLTAAVVTPKEVVRNDEGRIVGVK